MHGVIILRGCGAGGTCGQSAHCNELIHSMHFLVEPSCERVAHARRHGTAVALRVTAVRTLRSRFSHRTTLSSCASSPMASAMSCLSCSVSKWGRQLQGPRTPPSKARRSMHPLLSRIHGDSCTHAYLIMCSLVRRVVQVCQLRRLKGAAGRRQLHLLRHVLRHAHATGNSGRTRTWRGVGWRARPGGPKNQKPYFAVIALAHLHDGTS